MSFYKKFLSLIITLANIIALRCFFGSMSLVAALPMTSFGSRPGYNFVETVSIEIVLTKRLGTPDKDVGVQLMSAKQSKGEKYYGRT